MATIPAGINVDVVVVGGRVVVVVGACVVVVVVGRVVVGATVVVVLDVVVVLLVVVVVGARVVVVVGRVVVVVGRVVVVVGACVVVVVELVVVGGESTISVKDPVLEPSVNVYPYVPGVAVVKAVNVNVKPLWPTETPGALPLASATEPASVVTVTFTLLPGLMLADPGLTELISAEAGVIPTRTIASADAASTNPRAMSMPIQRDARDPIDRTMAPNDLDDVRRIRH